LNTFVTNPLPLAYSRPLSPTLSPSVIQAAASAVAMRWGALLAWACPASCSAAVGGVCAAASLLSCGAGGAGDKDQFTHERTQVV